jgi:hypothetical protein
MKTLWSLGIPSSTMRRGCCALGCREALSLRVRAIRLDSPSALVRAFNLTRSFG